MSRHGSESKKQHKYKEAKMLRNFTGSTGIRAAIAVLMLLFVVACSGSDSGIKRERDEARAAAEAAEEKRLAAEAAAAAAAKAEMERLAKIEDATQAIATATTAAEAQAAKDAVNDVATALEAVTLQAAVDARIATLATMMSADAQRMALMTAAGAIDTSDLMTQDAIDAANSAIATLERALAAATDVSDADKAMYQGQVDAAETAVAAAQSSLNHVAQTRELASAVTALQAIDLTDLSTQDAIDAANTAIAAVRDALVAATELSPSEKAVAMTELATADRTVMMAQGRFDTAAQKTALDGAVATLAALDLDDLMTQEQIDAANAAIIKLDLALERATNLTDAQKLDATVDVTLAKRKVTAAETVLAANIKGQTTALTLAGNALGEIDLDDLDTPEKIAAADRAVKALKDALDAATHISDADKAMYNTQLSTATDTVRTAQTGMDKTGRMTTQRSNITNAVTAARAAVGMVDDKASDTAVKKADDAIAELKEAIEGAEDLPEGDSKIAEGQGTLDTLMLQLAAAKTSRTDAQKVARTADMKKLRKLATAIGSAASTLADTKVQTDTSKPDTATDVDAPYAISGWKGMSYSQTATDKSVTTTVVYSSDGPATMVAFSKRWATEDNATEADRDGTYTFVDGAQGKYVDITGLPTNVNHDGVPVGPVVAVSGKFNGVPGKFTSDTTVENLTVGVDVKGVPTWTGNLNFKPTSATAQVSQKDTDFLNLGWWLTEAPNGDLDVKVAAWATGADYDHAGKMAALLGKATFKGIAVGKYTHETINEITGGHFNADAELVADFGDASEQGTLTGTISGFEQDGAPIGSGWKVELGAARTGSGTDADPYEFNPKTGAAIADGAVVDTENGARGTFGTQTTYGVWNAMFADDTREDDMPGGVTGAFHVGEASHPINMVGAFAAENQVKDQPK